MINKILQIFNKNEDGVAAIEAALILPVAILMFVGIFDRSNFKNIKFKIRHITDNLYSNYKWHRYFYTSR